MLASLALSAALLVATASQAEAGPGGTSEPTREARPGSPVAAQNVRWLGHADTPASPVADPSVTGLAFLGYRHGTDADVMFGNGPFGLAAWSLKDRAHPKLIGQVTAAQLALTGDDATKGFWEGERLQVDQKRKLVFMSRDPRAFGGNLQTGASGLYVIDARDPHHLRLVAFHATPAGHTTACIDGCRYLWTGGPFRRVPPSYNGQPAWVTKMTDPAHPYTYPTPVDLGRDDGTTAYVHSTDVDAAGVAWTSGQGGVRGYWTSGTHYDPVARKIRAARPYDPVPYAGGKIISPNDANYVFDHNAWRPLKEVGGFRPGELLFVTDEDFGDTCADAGRLLIVSLDGSYGGEGWRSTPQHPFRLKVVGDWGPVGSPGLQPNADCSAHWFASMPDVGNGNILVQAFYSQGTRFIDYSDPAKPRQVGYFVPQGTTAAAPAYHDGLVYSAQYSGGIDVIRYTPAH
jgi:hypothetical protein